MFKIECKGENYSTIIIVIENFMKNVVHTNYSVYKFEKMGQKD